MKNCWEKQITAGKIPNLHSVFLFSQQCKTLSYLLTTFSLSVNPYTSFLQNRFTECEYLESPIHAGVNTSGSWWSKGQLQPPRHTWIQWKRFYHLCDSCLSLCCLGDEAVIGRAASVCVFKAAANRIYGPLIIITGHYFICLACSKRGGWKPILKWIWNSSTMPRNGP